VLGVSALEVAGAWTAYTWRLEGMNLAEKKRVFGNEKIICQETR
jgi:hypothetical protein